MLGAYIIFHIFHISMYILEQNLSLNVVLSVETGMGVRALNVLVEHLLTHSSFSRKKTAVTKWRGGDYSSLCFDLIFPM